MNGPIAVWMFGLALLAASALGFFPMEKFARLASSDGTLSVEMIHQLASSQWTLALLLAVLFAPPVARCIAPRLERAWTGYAEGPRARALWIVGIVAFLFSWFLQTWLFGGMPHVTDAVSQQFQARIFAEGQWTAPAPPCPEAFVQYNVNITSDGKWFSKYLIGHPLWLAIGSRLGLVSFWMPLAWAIALSLFLFVGETAWDRPTARLAAALAALSPLGALLAASFMSHTTFLLYLAAAAAGWVIALHDKPRAGFLLLGAGLGLALVTRPQDLPTPAAAAAIAFLAVSGDTRRRTLRGIGWIALGAAPWLILQLAFNHAGFGRWLAFGYDLGTWSALSPKMSPALGFSETFTPADAVRQTFWTLLRFNKALFGWPASLLPLLLLFLGPRWTRKEWTCAAALAAMLALYFCYSYYGIEFEARYYSTGIPFVALLCAQALRKLHATWRPTAPLLLAFAIHAAAYYVPVYLWPRYSGAYEFADPVLHRAAREQKLENAVVLFGSADPQDLRYSSGFAFNDPFLRQPVIYARDTAPDCLRSAFPGRRLLRARPQNGTYRFEPLDP